MANGTTYAGEPVLLDIDNRLRTFLTDRLNEFDWPHECQRYDLPPMANPFSRRNRSAMLASPYPQCPNPGLNQLVVPTGLARFSQAMIVLSDASLAAVQSITGERILRFEYSGQSFISRMEMLPGTPIGTGSDRIWLVPLVDRRYRWARQSLYLDPSAITTWGSLIVVLANAIGEPITVDGPIHSAYGFPDKEFLRDATSNVGNIIDLVAMSIGKRAIIDSRGVVLTDANVSDDRYGMNMAMISQSVMLGGSGLPAPANPAVIGRRSFDYWAFSSEQWHLAPTPSVGTVYTTNWQQTFTGTDPCHNVSSDASTFASIALAGQIWADAAAWQGRQYQYSVAGVAPIELTGHDDYLAIGIDTDPNFPNVSSTLKSLPPAFGPRVNLSQTARYVHPHEVARFTIEEEPPEEEGPPGEGGPEEEGPPECPILPGKLIPADGDYDGSELQNVAIFSRDGTLDSPEPGTTIVAAYQAGLGWYRISGEDSEAAPLRAFELKADATSATLSAEVFEVDGPIRTTSLGVMPVYDPVRWFAGAKSGNAGLCLLQSGKHYAIQAPCSEEPPEEPEE